MTLSISSQHYVAGSNVPGFFWGVDNFPDSTNPDDTDLSLVGSVCHIQFKPMAAGPVATVDATVVSRTIDGVAHSGLLVPPSAMASTLTKPSTDWYWRFEVDLLGDGKPCYSEWRKFTVY